MTGPCAKTTVRCTLVLKSGRCVAGENSCANPQAVCPRAPGEDYAKCKSICDQWGHPEIQALHRAVTLFGADSARGARAFIEGHTYACMDCQHALFGAGVESISLGAPR